MRFFELPHEFPQGIPKVIGFGAALGSLGSLGSLGHRGLWAFSLPDLDPGPWTRRGGPPEIDDGMMPMSRRMMGAFLKYHPYHPYLKMNTPPNHPCLMSLLDFPENKNHPALLDPLMCVEPPIDISWHINGDPGDIGISRGRSASGDQEVLVAIDYSPL